MSKSWDSTPCPRGCHQAVVGIGRYEVMPDRVVFYLWPQAGGAAFDFAFRPRLGVEAKTASSVLYDHYNPEAGMEAPPALFTIQ